MDGHELWLSQCAEIDYTPEARLYEEGTRTSQAVSYTHLTLPTILLV